MNPAEKGTVVAREELARILASPEFSRSERLARFLDFVVQQALDGKADQLKETVIGIEVFGRRPDYDPRQDPVVRMEAAKLRARLAEYYAGNGATDRLHIEVPKGAYVPHWRIADQPRPAFHWKMAGAFALVFCCVTVGFLVWRQPVKITAASKPATEDPAALALYLKGRAALDDRAQRASQALQYFEQAIERAPNYALPYAGSADALFRMDEEHRLEHQQALDRARAAAERALQLDPRLSEAEVAMGIIQVREYKWQEAEQSFHAALGMDPNSIQAHAQLGFWLLLPERRWDEAIRELRRAVALDPLSSQTNTLLAYGLLWSSRFAEAEEQARKTAALDPPEAEPYIILGQSLYWQKKYEESLTALQVAYHRAAGGGADAWLACGWMRSGRRQQAVRLLNDNLPGGQRKNVPNRRLLAFYACLGDKERAFESIDKMYAEGEPHLPIFLLYRDFDWMHPDQRFAAMLKKIGLER